MAVSSTAHLELGVPRLFFGAQARFAATGTRVWHARSGVDRASALLRVAPDVASRSRRIAGHIA
jgi:hypothetical protein